MATHSANGALAILFISDTNKMKDNKFNRRYAKTAVVYFGVAAFCVLFNHNIDYYCLRNLHSGFSFWFNRHDKKPNAVTRPDAVPDSRSIAGQNTRSEAFTRSELSVDRNKYICVVAISPRR